MGGLPIGASESSASARRANPIRRSGMTIIREASTAFWHPNEARSRDGHQPKYPIEGGEPPDVLDRLPGIVNDNQLV
jgi:hypothetical protein